ncbi:MAG: hypothetical protein AAGA60_08380 [Cyanobacteria bacterium P01_E01_bin.42]
MPWIIPPYQPRFPQYRQPPLSRPNTNFVALFESNRLVLLGLDKYTEDSIFVEEIKLNKIDKQSLPIGDIWNSVDYFVFGIEDNIFLKKKQDIQIKDWERSENLSPILEDFFDVGNFKTEDYEFYINHDWVQKQLNSNSIFYSSQQSQSDRQSVPEYSSILIYLLLGVLFWSKFFKKR